MGADIGIGIIGAVSALSGVVISQVFSLWISHVERKHQSRMLQREKYEELVGHLHDALAWTGSELNKVKQGEQPEAFPVAARRVYALTLLYFSELKQEAFAFLRASEHLSGISGGLSIRKDKVENAEAFHKDMAEAGSKYRDALHALEDKIEECAGKYTRI